MRTGNVPIFFLYTSQTCVCSVVALSRIAFQEPELPLSQKKSEVILAKKMVLVGQVVNGGPLPNPPHHIAFCSFDSQNKYRGGEDTLAEPTSSYNKGIGSTLIFFTLTNIFLKHNLHKRVS